MLTIEPIAKGLTTVYLTADDGNGGVASISFKITINIIDTPNVVQQVSPLNNSVGNTLWLHLNWLSSLRASTYRLQISTDSTFAMAAIDTIGLSDTAYTARLLLSLTKYYWRVNASNIGGTSAWSSVWNFKMIGGPTLPIPVYPAANSVNIPTTLNFTWDNAHDILNAAKKVVPPIKPQGVMSSSGPKKVATISGYWFQLSTDTTSSNYIFDVSTSTDTTKLVTGLQGSELVNRNETNIFIN